MDIREVPDVHGEQIFPGATTRARIGTKLGKHTRLFLQGGAAGGERFYRKCENFLAATRGGRRLDGRGGRGIRRKEIYRTIIRRDTQFRVHAE